MTGAATSLQLGAVFIAALAPRLRGVVGRLCRQRKFLQYGRLALGIAGLTSSKGDQATMVVLAGFKPEPHNQAGQCARFARRIGNYVAVRCPRRYRRPVSFRIFYVGIKKLGNQMIDRIALIFIIAATSAGCAFTVHDTPIDYDYVGETTLIDNENAPQLLVGEIRDTRGVENKRMLLNLKNGYGQTTSGGYQAEKEISLFVEDALTQGIEAAGLNEPRSRSVTLSGELIDFDADTVQGWTKGTINLRGSVKLTATDNQTEEVLWRDTFSGSSSHETSNVKKGIVTAFSEALNNLVDRLFSDSYFQDSVLD
jgi:hypothetical protein